jgi:hypothetical protein
VLIRTKETMIPASPSAALTKELQRGSISDDDQKGEGSRENTSNAE